MIDFSQLITAEQKAKQEKQARLAGIDAQVVAKIRESYSIDDELYFARISVGSLLGTYVLEPGETELLQQYQVVVEAARAFGREQKALL